ncbi:MAG: hypothetical protein AAGD00_02420 [Planctomycetota bacterium]
MQRLALIVASTSLGLSAHADARTFSSDDFADLSFRQPVEPTEPAPALREEEARLPFANVRDAAEGPGRGVSVTVRGFGRYTFDADLDDAQGSVSIARTRAGVTIAAPIGEKFRLVTDFSGEASFWDFDGATGILPGTDDPWDDLYNLDLRVTGIYQFDDNWSLIGGGFVGLGWEPGADLGEAVTGGGFGSVGYRFSDNLTLSFGVAASSRLEDDARVIPIVGVRWQVNDQVLVESRGPGLRVRVDPNDDWAFFFQGGAEFRNYRLDEDGPLPDGVVDDVRIPIEAGVIWSPAGGLELELSGGAIVYQEFDIKTGSGRDFSEPETDPAGFISLALRWTF